MSAERDAADLDAALARERELFDAVADLPAAERAARLAGLEGDAALRERVLRLAQASDLATSRATRLARRMTGVLGAATGPELAVGDRLGPWRLVRLIGQGGMGAVFLGEREDGQFEQRAAIKLLSGVPSATALALLASERRILAGLSHPGIARLYDGGTTDSGHPYLVMEYVEGVALDAYASAHPEPLAALLALFVRICEAVSYAHARLVVHCDLKPSNILIETGERPVLLDFGIARLLGDAAVGTGSSPFTPRYASPELRDGLAIDAATDVYALGVILAELVGERGDADLRAVASRASAAEPQQRYDSVRALVQDLERWMERRPVIARPAGWSHRVALLLRRRWLPTAVAAAFLATITGFTVQLVGQRDRALAAEAQAKREAESARATSGFLQEVFQGADVAAGGGREVKVLSLVDRGRDRVRHALADQPDQQIPMLSVLSRVYANLGEPAEAETLLTEALAAERTQQPSRSERLAPLLVDLARLLIDRGRSAEAEPLAREAVERVDGQTQAPAQLRIDALTALALAEIGTAKADDADALLQRVLALQEQVGSPPEELAQTWYAQAQNLIERGNTTESLPLLTRAYEALKKKYGDDDPRTLDLLQGLGVIHGRNQQLDQAEALLRQVIERRLALYGEHSSLVSSAQAELAYVLTQRGRYVESAEYTQRVLAQDAATQGKQSPVYARTLNNLAFNYQNMGDVERCVAAFRESLAIRSATLPAGDLAIARAQNNLARFLLWLDRTGEARPLVEAALAARSAQLPPEHDERLESLLSATELARRGGDLEGAQRRYAEAAPYLEKSHAYTQLEGRRTHAWLAVSQRLPDAPKLIDEYVDELKKLLGATNPTILRGRVAKAEMLAAFGSRKEAAALARDLQAEFDALPGSYPADSVFHARLRALIDGAQR